MEEKEPVNTEQRAAQKAGKRTTASTRGSAVEKASSAPAATESSEARVAVSAKPTKAGARESHRSSAPTLTDKAGKTAHTAETAETQQKDGVCALGPKTPPVQRKAVQSVPVSPAARSRDADGFVPPGTPPKEVCVCVCARG